MHHLWSTTNYIFLAMYVRAVALRVIPCTYLGLDLYTRVYSTNVDLKPACIDDPRWPDPAIDQ